MKKIFLLFGFITFATLLTKGQEIAGSDRVGEKIKSLEIGYLTKQLQLTPEEAEKFWPVFNKYRNDLKVVATDRNITDELDRQQKALDIRKKYKRDFSSILSAERAQTVYDAEDRFKTMVRKEMQERIKARQEGRQFRRNK